MPNDHVKIRDAKEKFRACPNTVLILVFYTYIGEYVPKYDMIRQLNK